MNCKQCNQPVTIVPAGFSKRTNKPYTAFYKCKACGWGDKVLNGEPTTKDENVAFRTPQPTNAQAFQEINTKLDTVIRGIAKILEQNKIEITGKPMDEAELQDNDLPF